MSSDFLRFLGARQLEIERDVSGVHDVVIGIVVENKDDPAKLGRVQVRFPTLPIEDHSAWAPLAAIGAGADRGWWFLPEKGDEVLVGFEHGDVGRPVVLGALWNGKAVPPKGGTATCDVLVSRSGHRIAFDDDGKTITFEDGQGVGRVTIDAGAGAITLEALDGDVEVQAPKGEVAIVAKALTIEAKDSIFVASNGPITMGSKASAKLRGGSAVTVKGQRVDLNPPGPATTPAEAKGQVEKIPDPV